MSWKMNRKNIRFGNRIVYAIYYRNSRAIYYNLDFMGQTKIILIK